MKQNNLNIALYGGSFDPPHIAHEQIIKYSLTKLNIDKLIVIPTYLNPLKTDSYLTPWQRYHLMKKLSNNLNPNKIIVEDYEIKNNQATTTYQTLQFIKQKFNPNKIYLIIGEDNLIILHKWYNYKKILKDVILVVATRNIQQQIIIPYQYISLPIDINISSTNLRQNLQLKYVPKSIQQDIKNIFLKQN